VRWGNRLITIGNGPECRALKTNKGYSPTGGLGLGGCCPVSLMSTRWLLTAYPLMFCLFLRAQAGSVEKDSTQPLKYSVVAAPEWTDLFKRIHGWFGADGIFSIPLSGVDKNNNAGNDTTLLVFSDTFIGEVKEGKPVPGYTMVNNSVAYLKGGDPD